MATHPLQHAFQARIPAFGAWISLPSPFMARAVAQASPHLSWVLIDCEHGLTSLQPGCAEAIQAIQAGGGSGGGSGYSAGGDGKSDVKGGQAPSVVVRIPATGPSDSVGWQIKYALDAGARGVLVPMVSTREQATAVAAASRFPPLGVRGFGSPFGPLAWDLGPFAYVGAANTDVQVMVQIETKEAVQNVKEIADTPGIDVLFIGPFDLSMALGLPPPFPAPGPALEAVLAQILEAAHTAGKK
ncbi:phosphoenolpyruvate pyruvate domain-containing protein, partial [Athelia psychrophila]